MEMEKKLLLEKVYSDYVDVELNGEWNDLEEGEDLVSYPASPEEMEEGFKPKGKVGKMSFKYPKSMKKGVTEMSDLSRLLYIPLIRLI